MNDFLPHLKRIIIPLFNYPIYHGTSDLIEPKYIGRKKILEKIRFTLGRGISNTGIYLLTGFKGVGKSTLLNFLTKNEELTNYNISFFRFLRIFIFSIICYQLYFFSQEKPFLITIFLSIVILIININYQANKLRVVTENTEEGRRRFLKTLQIYELYQNQYRYLNLLNDVAISQILSLFALIFYAFGHYVNQLYCFLFLAIVYFIIDIFVKTAFLKEPIFLNYKRVFSRTRPFYIKVDVSQENISQEDILKQISRNLNLNYKKYLNSFSNKTWLFFFYFIVFFFTYKVYYSTEIYLINTSLKKEFGVFEYLPSQNYLVINDSIDLKEYFSYSHDQELSSQVKWYLENLNINRDNLTPLSPIKKLTIYFDLLVYNSYNLFYSFIFEPINPAFIDLKRASRIDKHLNNKKLFSKHLDYLFIVYFLIILLLFRSIKSLSLFGFTTHRQVLKKINFLEILITSELTNSNKRRFSINLLKSGSDLEISDQKKFKFADKKEIERHLRDILNTIDHLSPFSIKPEIIFVFDEFDKVCFKKEEEINIHLDEDKYESIVSLLLSLKDFFNSVKAKFIFVVGTQIYENYISDSEMKHFFHDSFYISSFLKDLDNENSKLSQRTEEFLYQYLIPSKFKQKKNKDFDLYKEYLEEIVFSGEPNKDDKIRKVLILINQFITYLTNYSYGIPRNLVNNFEDFIELAQFVNNEKKISKNPNQLWGNKTRCSIFVTFENHRELIVMNKQKSFSPQNPKQLCLVFDETAQRFIGFTHYLASPTLSLVNSYYSKENDKLIQNTLSFSNFIYKFHENGFSWRNINIIPEAISKGYLKFRELAHDHIDNLSSSHINQIVNGLFYFKISKRISNEIYFHTKISEEASGKFDFSIDDFKYTQEYYARMIKALYEQYSKPLFGIESKNYIHSISSLNLILGDIHFYNGEYLQALTKYRDCTEKLEKTYSLDSDISELTHLLLLIRIKLKIGLTLEKLRIYDTAYVNYLEIVYQLINIREIQLKELNLEEKDNNIETKDNQNLKKYDNIMDALFDNFNSKTNKASLYLSIFDGIRLVYQPILAKFQIIEKRNMGGIDLIDIIRLEKEFQFITKAICPNEKFLIFSEFYNKTGDILFYKNGLIHNGNVEKPFEKIDTGTNKLDIALNINEQECIETRKKILQKKSKLPCWGCLYYRRGLSMFFLHNFLVTDVNQIINICLQELKDKKLKSTRGVDIHSLANNLSDLGDCLLSCSNETDMIPENFWDNFLKLIEVKNIEKFLEYTKSNASLPKLCNVIIIYYLSGVYYKSFSYHKEYAFQFKKILYVIRESLITNEYKHDRKKETLIYFERIIKTIGNRVFYGTNESYSYYMSDKTDNSVKFKNPSVLTDYFETNIIIEDIRLRTSITNSQIKEIILDKYRPASLNIADTVFNRIYYLRYKAYQNYKIFRLLGFRSPSDGFSNYFRYFTERLDILLKGDIEGDIKSDIYNHLKLEKGDQGLKLIQLVEFLIIDSLSTLLEIIELGRIYNSSFLINHSFWGSTRRKLVDWIVIKDVFHHFSNFHEKVNIGKIEPNSLNSNALDEYIRKIDQFSINQDIIDSENLRRKGNGKNNLKFDQEIIQYEGEEKDKKKIESLLKSIYSNSSIIDHFGDENNNITMRIKDYIGERKYKLLNLNYQSDLAIKEYYHARETHTEGRTYLKLIERLNYLNDDLNDDELHFGVALERYRLNTGFISGELDRLKYFLPNSRSYRF